MVRASSSFVWVALVVVAPTCPAQEPSLTGQRVRLTLATASRSSLKARVITEDAATLAVDGGAGPRTIRREDIARLEVSRGAGKKAKGAAIGAVVGAALLTGVFLLSEDSCAEPSFGYSRCYSTGQLVALAAILGVPVGAAVGAAVSPGEQWEPVDTSRFRASVGPTRGGGVAARVAIAF